MYRYRITKYNPAYRDNEGIYLKDDWTSISDIGKAYNGENLTVESYRKVEDSYIKTIILVMEFLKIDYLIISSVRKSFSFEEFEKEIKEYRELNTDKIKEYYLKANDNDKLVKDEVDIHCRLLLRENIGSRVFYPRRMKVFIEYDYLMGIHTSKPIEAVTPMIEEMGLFVEGF